MLKNEAQDCVTTMYLVGVVGIFIYKAVDIEQCMFLTAIILRQELCFLVKTCCVCQDRFDRV